MLGVVLCGGESSRMHSDKGLLRFKSEFWAQTAIDKLNELELPVVISINSRQLREYSSVFPSQILIEDDTSLEIKGPLTGILSVHLKFTQEDLMILACDMLLMETDPLRELISQYNEPINVDTFVYTNDGEPEPLCGIYKATGLSKILQLYYAGQLPKHSMKYALEQMNTHTLPLRNGIKNCFRNFNTQEELNQL